MRRIGERLAMMAVVVWVANVGVAGANVQVHATGPGPFTEGQSAVTMTLSRSWSGSPPPQTDYTVTADGIALGPGAGDLSLTKGNGECDVTPPDTITLKHVLSGSSQSCDVSVSVADDHIAAADDHVTLHFDSSGVAPGDVSFDVYDKGPSWYAFTNVPGAPVQEGAPINLTVTRTGGTHPEAFIPYTISADNGSGVVKTTGFAHFGSDDPTATIAVPNPSDGLYGGDQQVTVKLQPLTGDVVTHLTIRDDDAAMQMESGGVTAYRTSAFATVMVRRAGDLSRSGWARYSVTPGTAHAGQDYTLPNPQTVAFPAHVDEAAIRIPLSAVAPVEDRTFTVQLVSGGYDDHGGTVIVAEPKTTTVTLAGTPAQQQQQQQTSTPTPPTGTVAATDAPAILLEAWTTPRKGGLQYFALPRSPKTVYIRVKVPNGPAKDVKVRLTGRGLKFAGDGIVTVPAGEVGYASAKLTRRAASVSVNAESADGTPLTAGHLALGRATNRITLRRVDVLRPSAHPKTMLTGTYGGATCKGKLSLYYNLRGARPRNAGVTLPLTWDEAGHSCTFTGSITWSSAIFHYSRLFLQVRGRGLRSHRVALTIKRR